MKPLRTFTKFKISEYYHIAERFQIKEFDNFFSETTFKLLQNIDNLLDSLENDILTFYGGTIPILIIKMA